MKHTLLLLSIFLVTASPSTRAAEGGPTDPAIAVWKDTANCLVEARGRVTSVKDAKVGGQPGVVIKAKALNGGKLLGAGIQGAKATDFPVGSDFCKADFGAD